MVALSAEELDLIATAAGQQDMAVGAWVGEAAVRVARQGLMPTSNVEEEMRALMMMRSEIMENRRLLKIAGGNLNDVARHANSTGTIHAATAQVLGRLDASVKASDAVVRNLDSAMNLLVDKLRATSRRRKPAPVAADTEMDFDPDDLD